MTRLLLLAALLLLAGCSVLAETRPVAAVGMTSSTAKLDDKRVQVLFGGVSDLLTAGGFRAFGRPYQSFYLTGDRLYAAGFVSAPPFGCTLQCDPRSAKVRFYEMQHPARSGQFTATEAQRRAVQHLAARVEAYLRRSVPATFQIRVGSELPAA